MKERSRILVAALFVLALMKPAAADLNEDDAAFIAKRSMLVGLEIGNIQSLGNSVYLVEIKSFKPTNEVLRLKPGVPFKALQVKATIVGMSLRIARTPLLKAGFVLDLTSGGMVLQSGVKVEKATSQSITSPSMGGLMIDDDD